jgi:ATP-binding cassette subfamily B multidrug efflux pump
MHTMIRTLLKRVREYKKESLLSPFFIALEVVLECLIPLVMAVLIDEMTEHTMAPILKYGMILLAMAALSLVFGVLSGKKAATASCGFAKNLRQDLYFKVQDFSFADIDRFSTSSLVTRLTTDVTNVQNAYQMMIRIAVRTPLMLLFSVVMSLTISPRMSVIFLVMIPLIGVALFIIMNKVFPIFKRIFKKYDAMNNSVQENIAGIRDVKSFVRETYETEKFKQTSDEVRRDFTRAEKILALSSPGMTLCIFAAILLVSYFGAQLIINSGGTELTTGQLSSLLNYGIQILISMMMLSMVIVMTSMAIESANRITEVLEQESSLPNVENGETEVADGSVVFDRASFRYSGKSQKNALENIDFTIRSGETVGIIGGTGAAKTTLIQLISRLYDATEGRVLVGGKDVKAYDLTALRNAVSVVLQKNILFSGTIKENLRWGDPNATDAELVWACELAQADEFIRQLPDQYDTYIERGGTNVSGGQKQRLCIARALLKKPKILILDDSTSAVDTKTDALIRKALQEEIPGTTKIIIAQRVASVEAADRIIVLDGGKIVEQGTHADLMQQNGIYREVQDSQTGGKEAQYA